MRIGLIIFFSFIFLGGCKNKNKIPHGIIPENKMEMMIWDLIRADEFITSLEINPDSINKKTESIKLYEQIFRIYHSSREEFQKSWSFYTTHPALLKVMMDSLSVKQRDTIIPQKRPKELIDSLRFKRKPRLKLP